jgi:FkbH-like protein
MYELEKISAASSREPLVPGEAYSYARDIKAASLLFWGEHCVECAAPACFQSCDLYRERPNGECRRFARGIVRNSAFPSVRGYGAEVSFKKWGKLEARGNTRMMSRRWLLLLERLIDWSVPVSNGLGSVAYRATGDARWRAATSRGLEKLGRKLHPRAQTGQSPDAFLLEIYNPGTGPEALHVVMTVARKELAHRALDPTALLPSYRKRVELPPGYSRHEMPHVEFAPVIESGLPFDIALVPESEAEPTLIFLSADFVRFTRQRAVPSNPQGQAPALKCVVWDLDNTMWNGILLEDEEVHPNWRAVEIVRRLDQRGILSSIASKNDFALATDKMKEIGIEEYVLFPQIGWMRKSDGIKTIAEKLNIGLDTFMFVDDNQFELDEVVRTLPMVTCVNTKDMAKLLDDPRLQGSTTAEAKRRRSMYRDAMTREREEQKFGGDFFGFLRSCEMKLRLMLYTPEYFERVCELVQRTNQLNFSGRKYKRTEIDPMLADERLEKWVLECSDKFGSYGVVGFGIVSREPEELRIEDFMLSCRVQGRFVEQAFFNSVIAVDPRRSRIWVNFRPTGRNIPAQQVLRAIGFEELTGATGMTLDLRNKSLACEFIEVECIAEAAHRGQEAILA